MTGVSVRYAALAIISFAVMCSSAWADTDFLCLKMCMASGKVGAVCMPMCTYGKEAQKHSGPSNPALSSNRVFPVYQAVDDNKLLPEKKARSSERVTTDYTCIDQCLQAKIEYAMCHKSCTKDVPGNGAAINSQAKRFLTPQYFQNNASK
jgi:hypothetical protein